MGTAFLSSNSNHSPHFNYKWHLISGAFVLILWEDWVFFPLQGAQGESRSIVSNSVTRWTVQSLNSPGQNTGVGSLLLLPGILPIQGSNPDLPYCMGILYQLSHKGSPRILEWVAYPFFRGSHQPRTQTRGLLHCRRTVYQLSYQGSPKEPKAKFNNFDLLKVDH